MGATTMVDFEFTLVVDHRLTDDEIDALFDMGVDDVTPERSKGRTLLHFNRSAPSPASALVGALRQVEKAGLDVSGVQSDDLVTPREIAARTGRSYESIRLLASGQRGPGGFPAPLQSGGWSLYSWSQVRDWLVRNHVKITDDHERDVDDLRYGRIIAAADHLIRARALMRNEDEELAYGLEGIFA